MTRSALRMLAMLGLLILFASACTSAGDGASGGTDRDQLPDLTLTGLSAGGSSADLNLRENERDRVLNLWAVWCAPCLDELPVFDDVAASTSEVDVIGINVGDSAADAQSLIDDLGLTFPQALDPASRVRTDLRITGMPATIFVSADGEVVAIQNGEVDRSELVALINEHFDAGLS